MRKQGEGESLKRGGGEVGGGEALKTAADLIGREAGEDDNGKVGVVALGVGEDVEAVHAGHLEVEEGEVGGSGLEEEKGGGAVGGFVDGVALAAQDRRQAGAL